MNSGGAACLLTIVVLPLAACTPAPAAPLPEVSIAMFSGRPDPSFTLAREPADALGACLTSGIEKPTMAPPDGLGFRYFAVTGLAAAPLLVGVDGAWLDNGGEPTPVALCPEGFSILRDAAVGALPGDVSGAIPKV